jgi:hypothetical protein
MSIVVTILGVLVTLGAILGLWTVPAGDTDAMAAMLMLLLMGFTATLAGAMATD